MKNTVIYFLLFNLFFCSNILSQNTTDVFLSKTERYSCFRIPSIVESKKGTLIAFAEARKNSCSDTGDIDIVLKRSTDGGKTWSEMITVWDDGDNVCGNPSPVIDKNTGRIILVACWNRGDDHEKQIIAKTSKDTRRVYVMHSDDEGTTWSSPKEITSSVKLPDWTWYATGPCHGIQLQDKKYKNRLLFAANHMVADSKEFHSHSIYSDDGGNTWSLGGVVTKAGGNESSIVELKGGNLMLSMRNYNRTESKTRSYALSENGGTGWQAMQYATELIEPICQGSILNYTNKGKITDRLLFSNPASTDKRINMTVRLSNDNGKSWSASTLIYPGPCAYSDLIIYDKKKIGLLYEYGEKKPYERIGFRIISEKEFK